MRWSYLCLARSHTTDKTSHRPMLMGQISSKSMVRRLLPGVLFLRRLSDWEVQVQEQDKSQQETKPEPHNLGSSWGDGWVCSLHCKTSHSEDTGALWPGGSQNVKLDRRLCLEGGVDVGVKQKVIFMTQWEGLKNCWYYRYIVKIGLLWS